MTVPKQRSRALDVMRGLTLALMIVVNMSIDAEHAYAQLLHASWHGLTLTDLVFPSFLFAVGAAMFHALPRYQAQGDAALLAKVLRRSALIFLCGFLLYWFPFVQQGADGQWSLLPLAQARILGVLQRIALAYGCAALLLHFGGRGVALGFALAALLLNWWVLAACGDDTLAGNAALKLDRWLLGEAHMYRGEGIAFDPEGLLGTLPATVNVLAGYFAARWLKLQGSGNAALARLAMAGLACIALALAWHGLHPLNKKLWTSSYTVVSIGVDLLALAALVLAVDRARAPRWAYFFEVFGRNTLFIYLLAELAMATLWLWQPGGEAAMLQAYRLGFQSWAGDKPGGLLFALAFMLGCWSVGWAMDRRGLYVRL